MSRPGDNRGGLQRSSVQDVVPQSDMPYSQYPALNIAPQPAPSTQRGSGFSSGYQGSYPGTSATGPAFSQPMNPAETSFAGKVAIPHLRASKAADASRLSKKGRTSHACDPCRKAKAGCSGGQPCSRCRTAGSLCVYGDGKRDRERKELSKLTKETQILQQQTFEVMGSLQRIRNDLTLSVDELRSAIDELILEKGRHVLHFTESESPATTVRPNVSDHDPSEERGEEDADAEVGSAGSVDVVEIDTDQQDTRGIGHLGKSSAVSWQHRTEEIASKDPASSNSSSSPAPIINSYHTEDDDMEFLDMTSIAAYEWPSPQLAGNLVQAYFDQVHNIHPILDKAEFLHKFQTFQRGSSSLSLDDMIWLMSLNCVMALAAFHGQLMSDSRLGQPNDHLLYCARASLICSQQEILLNDARVGSTSALGLLALYYLATSRINRAWTICGVAIRQALTLGLHVRSLATTLSDAQKEHRIRLWWALYSVECALGEITGRPSCITDRDIATPLPINIEEADLRAGEHLYGATMEGVHPSDQEGKKSRRSRESRELRPAATYQMPKGFVQPNSHKSTKMSLTMTSSTFFINRIRLCIITHEVTTDLYSAATIKGKWVEIEQAISSIEKRLQGWIETLPADLNVNFDARQAIDYTDLHILNRTGLAILYNATVMMLFRPCLCRLDDQMVHQSTRSKSFNHRAAENCIAGARRTIALIALFSGNAALIATIPPFWNTLHSLTQALSILLLEMAMKCEHVPDQRQEIVLDVKRGIRWLIMMSEQSISARKAWETFDRLLRIVAPLNHASIDDMPWRVPVPPGYNLFKFSGTEQPTIFPPGPQPSSNIATFPQPVPEHAYTQSLDQAPFPVAVNPLDDMAAMQRFLAMSQFQGQFDDPWQHHFTTPNVTHGPQEEPAVARGFPGQGFPPGGTGMYQGHRGSF